MAEPDAPYRSAQKVVSACHICGVDTTIGCPGCGVPLCLDHLSPAPHLCGACVMAQQRSRARINRWSGGLAAVGGGGLTLLLALQAPVLVPLGLLTGLTLFGLSAGVGHLVARRRARKKARGLQHQELERVAIAPQSGSGREGASRRQLSPRRGGHDPPSRPPGQRTGYHGGVG